MSEWREIGYLRKGESFDYEYQLSLPEPLASWDVFDYWERERINSIRDNVRGEDVLFDIGSEVGWMSVILARFCKIFLIESSGYFWPNIYQTWVRNVDDKPVGCFYGLIGEKSDIFGDLKFDWPDEISGEMIDKNSYQYLHDHQGNINILSIDDLVKKSKVVPTALNIDIEGAEFLALKGAKKLLSENNIKIWVSIHPDLMVRYNSNKESVFKYMADLGYKYELLAVDHEEHFYFRKK